MFDTEKLFPIKLSKQDSDILIKSDLISINKEGKVAWIDKKYCGQFSDIKTLVNTFSVFLFDGKFYTTENTAEVEFGYINNLSGESVSGIACIAKSMLSKKYIENISNERFQSWEKGGKFYYKIA